MALERKLRMGMVGGGEGAFIGGVHRKAALLSGDNNVEIVAGALSGDRDKATRSGKALFIPSDRIYTHYEEMAEKEGKREDKIDFVSIVTPNISHYSIAMAFLQAGINVVCDKPMTTSLDTARELVQTVDSTGIVFALTHNYTGYPLVKQARQMRIEGRLGDIRVVQVEYPQDWLSTRLEETGQKQADWRTDPSRAGISCCIGDIGSHCENLASYITGLELAEIFADLTTFVPGRKLDDNGNILLRYSNGARGTLCASQVSTGEQNHLRIRVYGTKAALEWDQEHPNELYVTEAGGPRQIMQTSHGYLCPAAARASVIPSGHTQGYLEAFAAVYRNALDTMRAKLEGRAPSELELDFPTVKDGARGVAFIEAAVKSSIEGRWMPLEYR